MQLELAELRRRLAARSAPEYTIFGDDGTEGRAAAATPAAVLIPVVAHPGGLTVLFTQRTTQLRSHSGQVSFPGGRAEPGDASAEFTALREVDEVFEVPLDFLLDAGNRQRRTREFQGQTVGYFVFEYGGHTIWGATAGMLVNLYRMLE